MSEQVGEQERGGDGQLLTMKEGAAPQGGDPETRTNTRNSCRDLSPPLLPFLYIRGGLSER